MKYVIYDILLNILIILLSPYFILKMITARKYRAGIPERFGFINREKAAKLLGGSPVVWFHAVSVGETKAALPLLRLFKEKRPSARVIFSTVTSTGNRVAREDGAGLIDTLIYLPLDLSWTIKRVIRQLRPDAFIVVEKEFWPNIYRRLNAEGVPIIVVNGTVSERSFRRFSALGFFFRDMFGMISFFSARTGEDRERAIAIGVKKERAKTLGNIKFDLRPAPAGEDVLKSFKEALGIEAKDKIIAAGSTHRGEEEMILEVFTGLSSGMDGLKLILAPRHPERFGEVEALIKKTGLPYARRTSAQGAKAARIILLDTIGELMSVYAFSTIALVGGSLVPGIGGHNLLEPAFYGKPVVYGAHLTTYLDMAKLLEAAGVGVRVSNREELSSSLRGLLVDEGLRATKGHAGKAVVEANRGAAGKNLEMIESFLKAVTPPTPDRFNRGFIRGQAMIGGIRIAIDRWMRDEHTGLAPHIALYLLSILYGASVRMRASLFAIGLIKTKRLPCRVISIGNLTVGGSGKTPMVMHIAGLLQKKGRRVVILSRGYKGSAKGVNAVSDGRAVLLGYKEAGDEPYLLARRLKGVPVVVGKDRCKSGLYAIKAFSPDVILLDDGFQHIRLERDVNLLLVDSKEGFGNGHLLPRGLLREPISGIKRADAALVKGGGLKTEDINRLKSYGLEPITFRYKASRLVSLKDSSITGPASIKGKRVLAVAGIASPGPFFQMLEAMGAVLPATLVYPDHHSYTGKDIEEIKKIKDSSGAELIVTTEKDGVKLEAFSSGKDGLALYALGIEVMTDDELLIKKIL